MSPSFFDFIASVLLLDDPDGLSDEARAERRQFVLKVQQVTGPVMAKGWEDTAFYRYYPLASLNEVGGDPTIPGTTIENFHRRIDEQTELWPHTMLATGTHDTKRGADLRARLNVLSEIPEEWEAAIVRWRSLNAAAKQELDGALVPDSNEEHLIYQTLVGTWPLGELDLAERGHYVDRIVQYVDKAFREAKLHTSWLNPYDEYDRAVADFIRAILADFSSPFVQDLDSFVRLIAPAGFVNSLAQTLVKLCAPGVPDVWQGSEFWDFNLVDPDNRRPVDFESRRRALACLVARADEDLTGLVRELVARWPDERNKMYVVWQALGLRRQYPALFDGDYLALSADGPRKGQLCAFARRAAPQWALVVVPRLALAAWRETDLTQTPPEGRWPTACWWRETLVELPADAPRRWRDVLSGEVLEAAAEGGRLVLDAGALFQRFPIALLFGERVATGPR